MMQSGTSDPRELADVLAHEVEGEVRFDRGTRALYATDASNYRHVPIGVVLPRTIGDVERTMALCHRFGAPVLPRGGGTSLAGQCCNVAVVVDFTKYLNRVLEVDPDQRRARVEAGAYLDTLRTATEQYGLTFGPDPATHTHCTLGGMIGNDSCGVHSVLSEFYGPGPRTSHSVQTLEVITADGVRLRVGPTPEAESEEIARAGGRRGEIYAALRTFRDRRSQSIRDRMPRLARRVSGYNLPALLPENGFDIGRALCGSEGTCATTLIADVTLIPSPNARSLLVLGYSSVFEAADHVPAVRDLQPIGLEGMDDVLVHYLLEKGLHADDLELLPEGRGWLLVEFGGENQDEARARARGALQTLRRSGSRPTAAVFDDSAVQSKLWTIRESGLGATAFVPGHDDTWPGWEDSAVPVERMGDYLRDLRALLGQFGYNAALYGHFGQGCVHCRIDFTLTTTEGIARFREFTRAGAELVVRHGGSLSGEHGDGQARADLLDVMYGEELVNAFREFKRIWDPEERMNPGKVIDASPRTANLRLGSGFRPATPPTHFRFPNDGGSFGRATLRCVGVGQCRRLDGGTMCPSYMVLREEKHSTRGRAHLMHEMLHGALRGDGWRSEDVKEALDLCLSCKGCTGECPVNVDVPTHKAEFLSHYYAGRLRPREAFAFGLIPWWARVASLAPGFVNVITQTPGLSAAAKLMAGMAPGRGIPKFAPRTFRSWFRGRTSKRARTGPRVLLWADTFNNHFHPETLAAAVDVLEHAGFRVVVPASTLCCGRPLYEYGMLDLAKQQLRRVVGAIRAELAAGTLVVGLEPSCVSVFRDEIRNLLPDDAEAHRLADHTVTLAELLTRNALPGYQPPTVSRTALVHAHCHHKSILGTDADMQLLAAMGMDCNMLPSGCCGMAGAFGFERAKYELSVAIGERVLLPAVRSADATTLIITDGFSCREQIAQLSGRRALHLAQVLQLGLHRNRLEDGKGDPEQVLARLAPRELSRPAISRPVAAGVVGGALLAGRMLVRRHRSRRTHAEQTA